jgi:hypothetical protein
MSSNLFCFIKKILIGFMAEEYEDIKRLFRISSQTFDDHTTVLPMVKSRIFFPSKSLSKSKSEKCKRML